MSGGDELAGMFAALQAENTRLERERDAAEAILASVRKEFATEECPMCSTPLGEQDGADEECAAMHFAVGQAVENHRAACRRASDKQAIRQPPRTTADEYAAAHDLADPSRAE